MDLHGHCQNGGMSYWHKDISIHSVPDFFNNAPSVLEQIPDDHNSWLSDGLG